jgi:hypothetical protein
MLYAYFAMIALTLLSAGGRMIKVFKGGKGEVVFDGGSVGEYSARRIGRYLPQVDLEYG